MKKSWEEARKYCQSIGGDLASIADQSESERIKAFLDQNGVDQYVWIGANDKRKEGTFEWSDGTAFSFSDWRPKEPNNSGNEDCAHLHVSAYKRKWNDIKCSTKFAFICKH